MFDSFTHRVQIDETKPTDGLCSFDIEPCEGMDSYRITNVRDIYHNSPTPYIDVLLIYDSPQSVRLRIVFRNDSRVNRLVKWFSIAIPYLFATLVFVGAIRNQNIWISLTVTMLAFLLGSGYVYFTRRSISKKHAVYLAHAANKVLCDPGFKASSR